MPCTSMTSCSFRPAVKGGVLEIPVANLASGFYLVKVCMDNGECETLKLIVR